ncbi:hypothetical protein MRA01_49180 [Methylobacterium radiotolerans]|nr:hypothetical protein MRA01_49180 [Methylobacterium radiotolerans]
MRRLEGVQTTTPSRPPATWTGSRPQADNIRQLDATTDLPARTALQTRLAQGEAALAEKRVALTRSEAGLQPAEMETGSRERQRILNEALTAEQGLHEPRRARPAQLPARRVVIQRQRAVPGDLQPRQRPRRVVPALHPAVPAS